MGIVLVGCLCAAGNATAQFSDLSASYRFLVSDRPTQNGVLYEADAGQLRGAALPLSFFDTAKYWGAYVCRGQEVRCRVIDLYDAKTFALTPEPGAAGDLQAERVNVHNGSNIYDAATWQIAVLLGAVLNKFGNPKNLDAYELASNQNRLLREGYSGNAGRVVPDANRAVTNGKLYLYNTHIISGGGGAYFFRMVPRTWLAADPLLDSPYGSWISARAMPAVNPDYRRGTISWSDWKPLTGENAWAFLLGPLHAAYIHYVLGEHRELVPFHDLAVQNALAVLPAFAAMQSPIGAVYYAPAGTPADAGQPVNPHWVSVENNFSLHAGLRVLAATLQKELASDATLNALERAHIQAARQTIATMIHGGEVEPGQPTRGLEDFFKSQAWRDAEFVQGGLANDPNQPSAWVPDRNLKAVDVNTWGIAALGPKQLDLWFGFGTAYRTWERLKTWGAYGTNRQLWGVGYSNQDGNGTNGDGTYREGILSAEWTAGAINMVRGMTRFYGATAATSADGRSAAEYVKSLKADELAMVDRVQALRFTNYGKNPFPGKPEGYAHLITQMSEPYLYASKRFRIPFGWYANPIPSTCATAWIVMLADNYDPFGYGGKPN
jgi:hypothetical protein